ncbi:MAG: UDP-glucose 4-epimerase, partial [Thermoplasmata archaeon]|nr:UDP-glucose 4-epimerase [Thermoplasmata archaeon]
DCVAAMLVGAERGSAIVEAYNLGTVDRTSVKEIAERVVAATGGRARIEFTGGERGWAGDIPQQHLAIERITALGWKPQWGSTAAVERTVGELAHGSH